MEQIVRKLEGVIKEVERKDKELTVLISDNEVTAANLAEDKKLLARKKKELSEREASIKGIEDVVLLSDQANATLQQAKSIEAQTKITVDAFATYEADQTAIIRQGILKNSAKEEVLKKLAKDLAEDKDNLEDIILARVKKILK